MAGEGNETELTKAQEARVAREWFYVRLYTRMYFAVILGSIIVVAAGLPGAASITATQVFPFIAAVGWSAAVGVGLSMGLGFVVALVVNDFVFFPIVERLFPESYEQKGSVGYELINAISWGILMIPVALMILSAASLPVAWPMLVGLACIAGPVASLLYISVVLAGSAVGKTLRAESVIAADPLKQAPVPVAKGARSVGASFAGEALIDSIERACTDDPNCSVEQLITEMKAEKFDSCLYDYLHIAIANYRRADPAIGVHRPCQDSYHYNKRKNLEVVRATLLLIEQKPDMLINAFAKVNSAGYTPLMHAVAMGWRDCVQVLCVVGKDAIDWCQTTREGTLGRGTAGQTVLELAEAKRAEGDGEAIYTLIKEGKNAWERCQTGHVDGMVSDEWRSLVKGGAAPNSRVN